MRQAEDSLMFSSMQSFNEREAELFDLEFNCQEGDFAGYRTLSGF